MKRKGQTMLWILFAFFIFMFGIVFINFIMPDVQAARADLGCSAYTTISDGTKLMCLLASTTVPYYILLVLSASGGILFEKILA